MSRREESKKRLVEFLWAEINRAILKSSDVKSSVKSLQALDLVNYVSDYNLVLDVRTLVDMILKEEDGSLTSLDSSGGIFSEDMAPKFMEAPEDKRNSSAQNSNDSDDAPADGSLNFFKKDENSQRIDGAILSGNEIKFQEHMQKGFDEDQWMRQVGIQFPEEK
jgi:hypothetical protein